MEYILITIVGGTIGLIATLIMKADLHQGLVFNLGLGILGATIGALSMGTIDHVPLITVSSTSLIASVLGASILIGMIKEFQRA